MNVAKPRSIRIRLLGRRLRLRFALAGLGWASMVCAGASLSIAGEEFAVIVNPDSGVVELSRAEVINIFLGRQRSLPSGVTALTVDLVGERDEKRQFYSYLVGKEPAEINSYWARLIFSGRGAAPWQAASPSEVLDIVQNYKGAIGYIHRDLVDGRARIVYMLRE
ncbi:hypothetical protein Thimo_3256 [Thioflavicoccus mobilis 8321]|uniref:Phosphate ABC transporter substrate-binding protein n=1 Tax=Thioflavicoccus mobilis 8321 TaxID=765912 RepID=L0H2W3_9GAMM|nr:hypothetical protein Thimo_3256 [Thioflavicoccus mobilis 8321]